VIISLQHFVLLRIVHREASYGNFVQQFFRHTVLDTKGGNKRTKCLTETVTPNWSLTPTRTKNTKEMH
jgi:hypothetical protein